MFNSVLLKSILIIGVLFIYGCAHNLEIPKDKLGDKTAEITLSSKVLGESTSVPVFFDKKLEVYFYRYNRESCKKGAYKYRKKDELGSARLKPSASLYKAQLPAEEKMILYTSYEIRSVVTKTCSAYIIFTPEEGKQYLYEFLPQPYVGREKCAISLREKSGDQYVQAKSAYSPSIKKDRTSVFSSCRGGCYDLCSLPPKKEAVPVDVNR